MISLLSALLFLSSCNLESEYTVNVKVKNNQGEPLDGAEVRIEKNKLGVTDQNGNLEATISLAPESETRVEVTKDSAQFYYAPYFKRFTVPKLAELEDGKKLPIEFEAILYSVPKPKVVAENKDQKKETKEETAIDSKDDAVQITNTEDQTSDPKTLSNEAEVAKKSEKGNTQEIGQQGEVDNQDKSAGELELAKELDVLNSKSVAPVIAGVGAEADKGKSAYPKKVQESNGDFVFTVQSFYKKRGLAGVTIYKGESAKGELREVCETNSRGRCSVRFQVAPTSRVTFVAKKKGYKTVSKDIRVKDNGVLRFDLAKGNSIDFFATTRRYNYIRGLEGTEVYVDGKKVGKTDKFGRFSYFHTGEKEDLIDVMLKAKNYLPEVYQTDFVIQGPMTVVKYYTPMDPPEARLGVLPIKIVGTNADKASEEFKGLIRPVVTKKISNIDSFKRVGISSIQKGFEESELTISYALKHGWNDTDLKSTVDALVVPVLTANGSKVKLEISLIDSMGRVLAAARETLSGENRRKMVADAVNTIVEKIGRLFPFEGTLIEAKERYAINIGSKHKRSILTGDKVFVWGVQSDKTGKKREHNHIATLEVTKVNSDHSEAKLDWQAARAVIQRGDLIQLQRTVNRDIFVSNDKFKKTNNSYFKIVTDGSSKGLSSANVYFDGTWIGSTSTSGLLRFPENLIGKSGEIQVTKPGYTSVTKSLDLEKNKTIKIRLDQKSSYLKIASKPSGAKVTVDGNYVGKTPLSKAVAVPSGFAEIEISGKRGYKKFKQVIEFNDGTLDLTGPQRILLEVDYLKPALDLLARGNVSLGLKKLEEIEKSHSDYLKARHLIAETYLTVKGNPERAIKEFNLVTNRPDVASFQDKRYVSAFVNLGVSHFKLAEDLASTKKWEDVVRNYESSIIQFDKVKPYLRFISKGEYGNVVHSVGFHVALAKHRIALITKNRGLLEEAYEDWRNYVDGTSAAVRVDRDTKEAFLDNAKIYLRQARVSLRRKKL
jgi:hypothetical protein